MLAGQTPTDYCTECEVNVEPNSSLDEHQRSRQHINRLLQLGLEIPLSSINGAEEIQLPEGAILSIIVSG